jgi:uncharacterized protein
MEFEFDKQKRRTNKEKHGIDFTEAQRIWDDPDRAEILARTEDEPRYLVVGKIDKRCWSAVMTHREGKVRIISVRRSRKEEIEIYEGQDV